EDEKTAGIIDEFENSIDNYLNASNNGERVPLLSNFLIPSGNLVPFLKDLETLEQKIRLDLPLFGSFITGNYSIRPSLRISEPNLEQRVAILLKTGDILINTHGGAIAGGYPEGRVKAIITNETMDKDEKAFYKRIKEIFDPNNILTPDAKLGTDKNFTLKHLRTTKTPKIML
ncbi:FAD-linked oxidase C-terminal domain-containing protein, partial [Ralstonia pseudosolanacearum]|uniref:FAD-linked oxidase C-terminal domain-containing protein n=1 Tax=Ralstonia pseudosolanacearum TaxID=1310165 RepID=UPI003D1650A6